MNLIEIERLMTEATASLYAYYERDQRAFYRSSSYRSGSIPEDPPADETVWDWMGPVKAMELLQMLAALADVRARLAAQAEIS